MRKPIRLLVPLAAAALTVAMAPTAAFADHANGTYQTTLDPLNGSGGSGMAMITIDDTEATVELSWSGLPKTFMDADYPHVQHIHIGAEGKCPTMDFDENGDGIVDTVEGQPAYGEIGTTLSTKGGTSPADGTDITIAPAGDSLEYSRTITLNQETLDALEEGSGVIVVHGLDPATLSKEAAEAKSNLVPELPLAATSPALCGALASSPTGGVDTGSADSGMQDMALLGMGGGLLAVGAAGLVARRRLQTADNA